MLCPYLYYSRVTQVRPHLIRPCLYYLYMMYHLNYTLPALALYLVALIAPVLYSVKQLAKSDNSIVHFYL